MSAVVASVFSESRSNRRHAAFSESRSDRRCCPLFRNPVRTKFPAGRSSSLLFILFFSEFICLRLLHPLFGTRSNRRHAAFSESRSDKASRRAELFFIIYIVLLSKFICLRLLHPLFGPAQIAGMPLFRNPVRTKLPAETFHPLRHRGPPCDKPRRILQTMFRSVTIFMRPSVSGNSLLPNRFSDRAHNFSNAHRERITAAASFFFF